jgi:hypothetical protein
VRRVRWSWVAVALIVLIGLYFVCDVVALKYIESRGAAQLAQTFDAESATDNLGSIPFLPAFFSGHLHNVSGHITGASAPGGLRIDTIDITLNDVSFSPRHLISLARSRFSSRTNVKAQQANVTLTLNERDIHDYLVSKVSSVRGVRVTSSGVSVMFNEPAPAGTYATPAPSPSPSPSRSPTPSAAPAPPPPPPPSTARFIPRVENGVFQFVLVSSIQVAYDLRGDADAIEELIRLPPLPQSLRSDVRLGDGVVVVEAVGRDVEMNVGEAQH